MTTSTFDPTVFLNATTTEALTRRPPLPVGEYMAVIGEPKFRQWETKKPDAKVKSGIAVDVPLEIDLSTYPHAQEVTGIPKVVVTTGIMLDTNEGGMIDWSKGKNGGLRRWREALGMNTPGEPFSLAMIQGRLIKVLIKHRSYEGENYEEVDGVLKAG